MRVLRLGDSRHERRRRTKYSANRSIEALSRTISSTQYTERYLADCPFAIDAVVQWYWSVEVLKQKIKALRTL